MRHGLVLGILSVAVLAAVPAARAQSTAGCFVAASDVRVSNGSRIDGDLTANDPGGRVRLGRNVEVAEATAVQGDLVAVGNGSVVPAVGANTILAPNADVGARFPVELPLFDPFCPIEPVECGGESLFVRKGDTLSLPPGVYGDVRLENGAELELAPGDYAFCRVRGGKRARILTRGAVTVGIEDALDLGDGSSFGPANGGDLPVVTVAGSRVRFGSKARIVAALSAPEASLRLGRGASYRGTFCAERVLTGWRVDLDCEQPTPPSTTSTTSTTTTSTTTTTTTSSTTSTTSTSTTTTVVETTTTSTSLPVTTTTVETTTTTTSLPVTTTTTVETTTTTVEPTTTTTTSTTTTVPEPFCGDGIPNGTEECDDGNALSSDDCLPTCVLNTCGDGFVDSQGPVTESCDDGNEVDTDFCPGDCQIDFCQPVESEITVKLALTSPDIAAVTLFLDYPEGKVSIPGIGTNVPAGVISGPGTATVQPNDFDHALRLVIFDLFNFGTTDAATIRFQACAGAAPTPEDFSCALEGNATDENLAPVPGVTCAVVIGGDTTTTTLPSTTTTAPTTTSTTTSTVPTTTTTSTTTTTTTTTTSTTTTSTTTTLAPTTTTSTTTSTTTTLAPTTTTSTTSSTTTTLAPTTTTTTPTTSTTTTTLPATVTCGPNGLNVTGTLTYEPRIVGDIFGMFFNVNYGTAVSIPGSGTASTARARFTNLLGAAYRMVPSDFDANANGVDDQGRALFTATGTTGFPSAAVVRVRFDCAQPTVPTAGFSCGLESLSDSSGILLSPEVAALVSCNLSFAPAP